MEDAIVHLCTKKNKPTPSLDNKIVIKKVEYGSTDISPFKLGLSLRELSKVTGLDHAYLGKVKNGKIPITGEKFMDIMDKATNAITLEGKA